MTDFRTVIRVFGGSGRQKASRGGRRRQKRTDFTNVRMTKSFIFSAIAPCMDGFTSFNYYKLPMSARAVGVASTSGSTANSPVKRAVSMRASTGKYWRDHGAPCGAVERVARGSTRPYARPLRLFCALPLHSRFSASASASPSLAID